MAYICQKSGGKMKAEVVISGIVLLVTGFFLGYIISERLNTNALLGMQIVKVEVQPELPSIDTDPEGLMNLVNQCYKCHRYCLDKNCTHCGAKQPYDYYLRKWCLKCKDRAWSDDTYCSECGSKTVWKKIGR